MKIGILGSGNMGRSLGTLWAEQNHEVFFGARTVEQGKSVAETVGNNTQGGTNDRAAEFGDVLLYTIRGVDPNEVLTSIAVLKGKIIIDCNNFEIPEDFDYKAIDYSLAEQLASQVPQAHVVKAFNTFAQEVFELAPSPLKDYDVSCFVAGDNEAAKQKVMQLAKDIGFTPIDSGKLRNSRMLEKLGDFIRYMIGGQELGSYATISIQTLPAAKTTRLGGRQASNLS